MLSNIGLFIGVLRPKYCANNDFSSRPYTELFVSTSTALTGVFTFFIKTVKQ